MRADVSVRAEVAQRPAMGEPPRRPRSLFLAGLAAAYLAAFASLYVQIPGRAAAAAEEERREGCEGVCARPRAWCGGMRARPRAWRGGGDGRLGPTGGARAVTDAGSGGGGGGCLGGAGMAELCREELPRPALHGERVLPLFPAAPPHQGGSRGCSRPLHPHPGSTLTDFCPNRSPLPAAGRAFVSLLRGQAGSGSRWVPRGFFSLLLHSRFHEETGKLACREN